MNAAELRRRLQSANPVPASPPRPLSAADQRLLSDIVGTPRRRASAAVPQLTRVLAVTAVAAACVIAVLTVVRSGSTTRDEVEAIRRGAGGGAVPAGAVVHVVTRVYAAATKNGVGTRVEGWAQPSSGRARIVVRAADGTLRSQETVDRGDAVRSWTRVARRQLTSERRSARLATHERGLVTDRLDALVRDAQAAIDRQSVKRNQRRVRHVRYAGRATIETVWTRLVRIGVATGPGQPLRLRNRTEFMRTYVDAETGASLGFERGWVRDGRHIVDYGERVLIDQVLTGDAADDDLGWKPTPRLPDANRPTPTLGPTPTPTPTSGGATPTPTPTSGPGMTPTP